MSHRFQEPESGTGGPERAREFWQLANEFPPGAAEPGGLSRRSFVKLLGASAALAGLGGCMERPREKILPYVNQPPEEIPGLPQYYATAMVLGGFATGLLVESNAGRPTKVEGNPDHPASLGAAGVYEQASVLQLYDPDRARTPARRKSTVSWPALAHALAPTELRSVVGARGAGLRLLLEPTSSPILEELLSRIQDLYPEAGVHFYAPLSGDEAYAGSRVMFGRALQPRYDFSRADVVLALDADFLDAMPFHLRYARDFARRRRIAQPNDSMNRLYVAEGVLSGTGALADHRVRVLPREVRQVAAGVLGEVIALGMRPVGMPAGFDEVVAPSLAVGAPSNAWIRAVAHDLVAARGRGIVIVGERQPAAVHAVAHLLNAALGNLGHTVSHTESPLIGAGDPASGLAPLVEEMRSGQVEALAILGGNPAYTAPADAEFTRWLLTVPTTVYFGLYRNETARSCTWFAPALHYLESWGDARAYDGTASVVQPLIAPLYGGRTPADMLALVAGESRNAHELVRDNWRRRSGASGFEGFWDAALQRGVIAGTAAAPVTAGIRWDRVKALLAASPSIQAAKAAEHDVVFLADPRVYDGSFGNNAWLQELPDPITKLTWDNAALVSPQTAEILAAETGDFLELEFRGRRLRIPALVAPGQVDGLIGLRLGYGRGKVDEAVARDVGFDAYRLRTSDAAYFGMGLHASTLRAGDAPARHPLAITQAHWTMDGRPLVLRATLDEYRRNPQFTRPEKGRTLSLYEPHDYTGDQWAMVIDLSTCTGCSACVVACQAENNTPVVGKEGVLDSREMHWLRIDRYYSGGNEALNVATLPMLCQHCEKAPCEYVCPVSATVHSPDGLNEMVYNRCVGTRFCSNNCPYKVRRFNWFDYNKELAETERMVKNPDVTVRARGVMEKCTFCVQRIRRGQISARLENRPLGPAEVRTACQQACPTQAIAFGSYTNSASEVARRRAEPRIYSVLHELGTEPRVQYLARLTNPNPAVTQANNGA